MKIKLSEIRDNPNPLRTVIQDDSFYELADSIRKQGLLQPIKVRPIETGYELVYGHRRVAAMRHIGLNECEAIIEQIDENQALLEAIAENLQRSDLTVFEEAVIYKNLRDRNHTVSQIAETVNKPQGHISNRLSLLRLPNEVQQMIKSGSNQQVKTTTFGSISVDSASRISAATSSPEEAIAIAKKSVEERLTGMEVRELTSQIKKAESPKEREFILKQPFRNSTSNGDTYRSEDNGHLISKSFHTSNRSIGDQFHSKWIWNLRRINLRQFDHFTVGYSQRNWEQLFEILKLAGVTILLDARKNAISQYRPEFSKANLKNALRGSKIEYQHIPELGIDSDNRSDLANTHDYASLFDVYSKRVTKKLLMSLIGDKLSSERIAFLCVEFDPETCHRHKIALTLEKMGYQTLDL